jgi:Glycosyltransferase sugar-binding region containing DXD motif
MLLLQKIQEQCRVVVVNQTRRQRRRPIISVKQQTEQERKQQTVRQPPARFFFSTTGALPRRRRGRMLMALLVIFWWILMDRHRMLGHGPTLAGGRLGQRIDNSIKLYTFYWRAWSHAKSVRRQLTSYFNNNVKNGEDGYEHLPACPEEANGGANRVGVHVLLNAYLEETILRGMARRQLQDNATRLCPLCQHSPLVGDWYQPIITRTTSRGRPHRPQQPPPPPKKTTTVIPYQESEMEAWMSQHFGSSDNDDDDNDDDGNKNNTIYQLFQGWSRLQDRVQLWGILAVYLYGGEFRGPRRHDYNIHDNSTGDDDDDDDDTNFTFRWHEEEEEEEYIGHHSLMLLHHQNQPFIQVIASTQPRHDYLECLVQFIYSDDNSNTHRDNEQQHCSRSSLSLTTILHQLDSIVQDCLHPPCDCNLPILSDFNKNHSKVAREHGNSDRSSRFQVEISASTSAEIATTTMTTTAKDPQSEQLRRRDNCSAGWFCNLCLKLPWRGSFASCASFCRPCYINQICNDQTTAASASNSATNNIVIHVNVKEAAAAANRSTTTTTQKRIPRIIHQTWLEELTAETYPHLHRLQNSWKAQTLLGWEYRFYTDETMRDYIIEHYSSSSHQNLFLDAYDALIPGAFRADLFRLLVLFKHGGVYADIDVQLDVNQLDYLIPHNLGYFVPRDVAIDRWPDSNFCLWNGLQGAAPGHPIVAQAIQDLLNHILNRHDYYDLESQHCQHHDESGGPGPDEQHDDVKKEANNKQNLNAEIWKLRSFPLLILTGPCALGVSVNTAMERHDNRLQGFNLGWLVPNQTNFNSNENGSSSIVSSTYTTVDSLMGDVLILLTDRYDLGELRFTDIDRNLLVASSNADKFSSTRLLSTSDQKKEKTATPVHYSKFEHDIMGSQGIYKDNQVLNKKIIIQLTHSIVN